MLNNKKYESFMITPFHDEDETESVKVDKVYEIMKMICERNDVLLRRDDEYPYESTEYIHYFEKLSSADIIIANLSYNNPNCFYELGISHTIDKPKVIHVIEKCYFENRPTDIKGIVPCKYEIDNLDAFEIEFETQLKSKLEGDNFNKLKIGISRYPEMELINVAVELNLFKKLNITTDYVEWNQIVDELRCGKFDLIIANTEVVNKIEKQNYLTDFVVVLPIFEYKNFAVMAKNKEEYKNYKDKELELSKNGKRYDKTRIVQATLAQMKNKKILASENTDHYDILDNLNRVFRLGINLETIKRDDSPFDLLRKFLKEDSEYDFFIGGIPERIVCSKHPNPSIIELISYTDIVEVLPKKLFTLKQVNAFITTLERYKNDYEFQKRIEYLKKDWKNIAVAFHRDQHDVSNSMLNKIIQRFNSSLVDVHLGEFKITSDDFRLHLDNTLRLFRNSY